MRKYLLVLFLLVSQVGCDQKETALFSTPYDFPDPECAGLNVFINVPSQFERAEELRAEIMHMEAEICEKQKSPDFLRMPLARRSEYLRSMRNDMFVLMLELRAIIHAHRR